MAGPKRRTRIRYPRDDAAHEQIHIHGVDLRAREIYLFGRDDYIAGAGDANSGYTAIDEPGIDYAVANQFIKNLRMLEHESEAPVLVHLKTCGGFWEEGMAIFDAIKASPNHITIVNYAAARSMSSLIFLAGDRRVMMRHGTFMLHRGTIGFDGTGTQFKTEYKEYLRGEHIMEDIYIDAMCAHGVYDAGNKGRYEARIWLREQMNRHEDVWFTAAKAVEYGFADEIFTTWKALK